MRTLLNVLSPAPHLEEIQDKDQVEKLYGYWRLRTLYSMFIGYALFYFSRRSFIAAMPGLIEDLGFTKQDLGILGTVMAITYGMSKFASGVMSDRSNPRYFMAIGLFCTGLVNIFFGMSSSLVMLAFFWGANGWFQGFGWPPCTRLLTHWYSHSERGSWWSTWSVSQNVGAFLIPWIVGFALQYWGWRTAMYVPGVICILGSLFLINRLRDTPQSLGLPSIEKFRNDYAGSGIKKGEVERELTTREILFEHVLCNRYIWLLAAAYFFVYFVRMGVNDWTGLYLYEVKEYSRLGASGFVSFFDAGGLCGSLCAGWLSDRVFGARRGPVNILFACLMLLSIILFRMVPPGFPVLDLLVIFFMGFAVFGPQMLIGVMAAELSHKKAAATATGFAGWFAYLGAAMAGYPLSMITQEMGWEGYFFLLTLCCGCAIVLLLPLLRVTDPRGQRMVDETVSSSEEKSEPEFA